MCADIGADSSSENSGESSEDVLKKRALMTIQALQKETSKREANAEATQKFSGMAEKAVRNVESIRVPSLPIKDSAPHDIKPEEEQLEMTLRIMRKKVDPQAQLVDFQKNMEDSILTDSVTQNQLDDLSLWIAKLSDGISYARTCKAVLESHVQDLSTEENLLRRALNQCEEIQRRAVLVHYDRIQRKKKESTQQSKPVNLQDYIDSDPEGWANLCALWKEVEEKYARRAYARRASASSSSQDRSYI